MAQNNLCKQYVDPEDSVGHLADYSYPFHRWALRAIESIQLGVSSHKGCCTLQTHRVVYLLLSPSMSL